MGRQCLTVPSVLPGRSSRVFDFGLRPVAEEELLERVGKRAMVRNGSSTHDCEAFGRHFFVLYKLFVFAQQYR